jgi:hypothetical protein
MRRRLVVWFLAGALAGALCAAAGVVAGRDPVVSPAAQPEVTETTSPAAADGDSAGNVLGNTEIVPTALTQEFGEIRLEYELIGLGGSTPSAVPTTWTMRTTTGETLETNVSSDESRVAIFRPETEMTVDDIESITVTGYAVRSPQHYQITLSLDGDPVTLVDGTTVAVRRVLEQRSLTYVQLAVEHGEEAPLGSNLLLAVPVLIPLDEGFEEAALATTAAGFASPQFRFRGERLPDDLAIEVESAVWDRGPADLRIDLTGTR